MKKAISFMLIAALFTTMTFTAAPAVYAADSPSVGDSEYVKDEVLVVFEEEPSKKELRSVTDEVDAKKVEEVETPVEETPYVVTLDKGESVEDAVKDLEKEKAVAYAQPNYLYSLDAGEDNELASARAATAGKDDTDLWNLKKVDTQQAWDLIDEVKKDGQPREKVTVAVLDSGVDTTHTDLKTMLNVGKCVDVTTSGNRFGYAPLTSDEDGHGTKVSGVIAAESGNGGVAGVAAGNSNDLIELVVIDVYEGKKGNSRAKSSNIIAGIEYACSDEVGAKVVNMSLGHDGGADSGDQLLQNTINEKTNQGVAFVASAGNEKSTKSWYPSDMPNVLGVISTENYTDAYGICKANSSNYGPAKDLSAPGHRIQSTSPGGYSSQNPSGTSYAAPVVASVAAMMYYVNPSLTPSDVESILEDTATDLYTDGRDDYTGAGNVNAYAAVGRAAGISVDVWPGYLAQPTLTAKSSGYNSIRLSWNTIPGANSYRIFRSTSKDGLYTHIKTLPAGSTSYTNTSLSTGKQYYYKVDAYGTRFNKKTTSPLSAPAAAQPSVGVPQSVKLYHTTYTGIKLKWKKVSGASGYNIYRATSKNGKYSSIKRITKGSTVSYTNSKLKPNRNYYYKVRAYRTVSGKRLYGSYSSAKALKTTPAKTYISLKKNKRTRKATITWKKVSTVSGYVVYYATSKNGKYRKSTTKRASSRRSFTSKRLKKGKTYYYKARAYKTYRGKRIYGPYSDIKKCKF